MFALGCHIENPYKPEKVILSVSKKEMNDSLHSKFNFKNITISGINFNIKGNETVDLQAFITNPSFKESKLAFAKRFSNQVKK
ncbi:hypothetical protein ACVWYN_001724 [Pedobacter sp. UYP24]